ncbi:MAG: hypothetical protein IMZ53_13475, partial [Thermoplasmata archaeon]|nr:hypothetical protein [Thermoplasmata archaeon]
ILLSIIFFLLGTTAFTIYIIRNTTSQEAITQIVKDIDVSTIHVGNVLNSDSDEDYENMTLAEWIYENADREICEKYNISEESIETILEKYSVKTFLAEKLSEYFDDLYRDSGTGIIASKEIVNLIKKNSSVVYKATGYQFTNSDYDEIAAVLFDDGILDTVSLNSLESSMGINLSIIIRWTLSYYTFAALSVLMLLLLICIFLINRKLFQPTSLYIGIPFCAAGIIFTAAGVLINTLVKVINSYVPIGESLLKTLLSQVRRDCIKAGLIILAIGIVFIGCHIIINKIKQRKASKLNAASAD